MPARKGCALFQFWIIQLKQNTDKLEYAEEKSSLNGRGLTTTSAKEGSRWLAILNLEKKRLTIGLS